MIDILKSFFDTIISVINGIVHFFSYLPKFFTLINYGTSNLIQMFNYLPSWFTVLGGLTIAVAVIWIIIEII